MNPNQLKYLFAMQNDKKKGLDPKAMNPSVAAPKPMMPKMPSQNVPSLPQMNKVPKFGKIKKFFKK